MHHAIREDLRPVCFTPGDQALSPRQRHVISGTGSEPHIRRPVGGLLFPLVHFLPPPASRHWSLLMPNFLGSFSFRNRQDSLALAAVSLTGFRMGFMAGYPCLGSLSWATPGRV